MQATRLRLRVRGAIFGDWLREKDVSGRKRRAPETPVSPLRVSVQATNKFYFYEKNILMKNYYQILDVAMDASQDIIKEQYRFLVQAWHPDKFPNPVQKLKAEEKLKEINVAYEILRNPVKRAEYESRIRYTHASHEQEYRTQTNQSQAEKRYSYLAKKMATGHRD